MAGPGGEVAPGAGGRGYMRASHADRERAVDMLKAAFIQGRLDREEFDLRVSRALASRTYADLAALTADIPAGLTGVESAEPARRSASKEAVTAVASVSVAWTSIWVPLAVVDTTRSLASLILMVVLISVVPALLAGYLLTRAWLDKRAGRRSSPGPPPGAGGEASGRPASATPAGQLPRRNRDPRQAAEAAPIRRPCPSWSSWRPSPRSLAADFSIWA
jgi:Domain of unknown function (DUF1707)